MALTAVATVVSMVKSAASPAFRNGGQAGDGREQRLLEYVQTHARKGDPASVLAALDELGRSSGVWYMHIGSDKGAFLDSAIAETAPKTALEIGSYCGYSAVRIASRMAATATVAERDRRRPLVVSVEMNPDNCAVARAVVDHAGLSWAVRFVQGKFQDRLDDVRALLAESGAADRGFEFVFMDHWKDRYLPDYLLLRDQALLADGCCVFADNMGYLFARSDFRKYLDTHTDELSTETRRSHVEYISLLPDAVTISRFHKLPFPFQPAHAHAHAPA